MELYDKLIKVKTEQQDFKTIVPSRFITFELFMGRHLRIAILDSPHHHNHHHLNRRQQPPQIAALIVPFQREQEWVFSTDTGHLQLLLSCQDVSRLILIGDSPITAAAMAAEAGVTPSSLFMNKDYKEMEAPYMEWMRLCVFRLSVALSPPECVKGGDFKIPIVEYSDHLVSSVVLETCVGVSVGEMLVEDVEIESSSDWYYLTGLAVEFRRRLRFKRMPNLLQTEVRIVPAADLDYSRVRIVGQVGFKVDGSILVDPYLSHMVAGISLIAGEIGERIELGFRPKALCLGVGGGALLSFLTNQLGFDVSGVEADEKVLWIARKYFELGEGILVHVGDAIEYVKQLCSRCVRTGEMRLVSGECGGGGIDDASASNMKFDVVMVDLDSCDPKTGASAPPSEFIEAEVVLAARSILSDHGILVVNVIPMSELFFDSLKDKFRMVFPELYKIDVGNDENHVIVAMASPHMPCNNTFLDKLKTVISGNCFDPVEKI